MKNIKKKYVAIPFALIIIYMSILKVCFHDCSEKENFFKVEECSYLERNHFLVDEFF